MKRLSILLVTLCAALALLVVSSASAAVNATLTYHLDSDWGSGFQARLKIKNNASTTLSDWTLEFDLPHNLTSIWDAQIASHNGTRYVVIPLADNFYKTEIDARRQNGGNVIVSFGGANGIELAQACNSVSATQAQYQAAMDRYNFTHIDFDIEGAAQAEPASIDRRNKAIAALQANAAMFTSAMITSGAQNKTLHVSFTLPALPTGLTQDGMNVLNNALANGVVIDEVNIMAMDYGGPSVADPYKMGDNAIAAATSLQTQLKTLYPSKTDAQLWAMVGVTPMIGLNDVTPEVFTLADAQKVLTFAQQKNLARLAMWSTGRDQSCPNNGAYVAPDCSGIVQTPWDFSNVWKGFTQ